MELLPRTTRGQAMDVLSSQANLAGYRAVIEAMHVYTRVMPMMMTAAGTVTPAKVFVVGAGVAGLQAIATAKRMGAVVSATDVRPAAREEIESLAAKFVGFIPQDAATKGGYARALTKEEQAEQARMVAEHIKGQDIVITTAQIPGRKAPRIVTAEMVALDEAGLGPVRPRGRDRRQHRGQPGGRDGRGGRHQARGRVPSAVQHGTRLLGPLRPQPVQLRPAPASTRRRRSSRST